MQFKTLSVLLAGMIYAVQSMAFPCHYTVTKACCWTPFNVNVEILDVDKDRTVVSKLTVPAGKTSLKNTFECQPSQKFELVATYTPVIWDNDKDKVFRSRKYIALKSEISPTDVGWHIPIAFPDQFAEVPLPLNTNNCQCAE